MRQETEQGDNHDYMKTDSRHCLSLTHTQTLLSRWYEMPRGKVKSHRELTASHSVVKSVRIHHYAMLWRLLMSDSKHRPETVLNANSVLCNQQTGDNVSGQFVTATACRSHECIMTAAQRETSKSVPTDL